MSTLIGNYLILSPHKHTHTHTHTRLSSISLHNIISHRVVLPQILNIRESSWHIVTPFRTFLSGQAAFLPRPWMLRMGVRQQKVYGSQAGLVCRMILDASIQPSFPDVSRVLHRIASYCIILHLIIVACLAYFLKVYTVCMSVHVFAFYWFFLQSFGFFGVRWSLTVQLWLPAESCRPQKMLWFLIVPLFTRAAVGVHDDVATGVCEAEWFDARASWADLDLYCQNWQGPRIYQCLDLFSHSQRLAHTFTRHAKQAIAYDIASNQEEDILARSGFYLALDLVLMLLELSLAHFLMSPCVFLLQGFPGILKLAK